MSDILATPIDNEELKNCSVEELQLIKQSWINEKNAHLEKLQVIENTLIYIHMQLCEKGAYNDSEQTESEVDEG